jgi:hypothetical protein
LTPQGPTGPERSGPYKENKKKKKKKTKKKRLPFGAQSTRNSPGPDTGHERKERIRIAVSPKSAETDTVRGKGRR